MRPLALVTAVFAAVLVALSPLVRISGSGLGCGDDWPLCNGRLIPRFTDFTVAVEWGHRLAALGFGFLMVALVAVVLVRRTEPGVGGPGGVLRPTLWALLLVVPQGLLGRLAVKTELQYAVVVAHWATALALVALVLLAALRTGPSAGANPGASNKTRRGALGALGVAFAVLVLGGLTANLNAGMACEGFPLCSGRLWPAGGGSGLAYVHWVHRLLAYGLTLHVIGLAVAVTRRAEPLAVRRATLLATAVLLVHIGVAIGMIYSRLSFEMRTAHAALGTGLWIALLYLAWEVRRSSTSDRLTA